MYEPYFANMSHILQTGHYVPLFLKIRLLACSTLSLLTTHILNSSFWWLVIIISKGIKVGILPLHQLLWFLASIYFDPGFESLISERWVPRFYHQQVIKPRWLSYPNNTSPTNSKLELYLFTITRVIDETRTVIDVEKYTVI